MTTTPSSSGLPTRELAVNDTTQWLVAWFEKRRRGQPVDVDADFYVTRMVDSFGIIELIDDIENHFAIMFDDEDFQQPHFRQISGLAVMIREKRDVTA